MSTVAQYQLETSPYPISMASPGETWDWSLEQMARDSSDQPKVRILRLALFSIVDEGYYLLPVDFDVQQIMRQSERDARGHMMKLPRSSLVSLQANLDCLNWTSHLSSTFFLWRQWVSKTWHSKFSYNLKSYFVEDGWYTFSSLLTEYAL